MRPAEYPFPAHGAFRFNPSHLQTPPSRREQALSASVRASTGEFPLSANRPRTAQLPASCRARPCPDIVQVPPPGVGRIELRRHPKVACQLREAATQARDRHHAVLAALAAYEHTGADVPVIAVHARRPGKVELLPYRFHGASPEAAAPADAAGADAVCAGAAPSFGL